MTLVALAVAATLADLATFVALLADPTFVELGPVAARSMSSGLVIAALAAKLLLVVVLVTWRRAVGRHAHAVLLVGLAIGTIGAFSNVAVLVA